MKLFSIAFAIGLGACGAVPNAASDASTGDDNPDTDAGPCGAAGQTCCASDTCDVGLACTSADQVCRAAEVWVVGTTGDGNDLTGMAMVGHGDGTSFTLDMLGTGSPTAISGTSASDVWAIVRGPDGNNGQTSFARHWNGVVWGAQINFPEGFIVTDLWGNAPNNYWAVDNGGTAMHFDGVGWSAPLTISAGIVLTGVWGSSASNVWAVGQGTVAHWDGTGSWAATTRTDFHVYGSRIATGRGSSMIVGGAAEGAAEVPGVLRLTGSDFTVEKLGDGLDCATTTAVWSGPDDEWALTASSISLNNCDAHPTVMHHVDGVWTGTGKLPNASRVFSMWGSSNRDLFVTGLDATGAAAVFHYDGTTWKTPYTTSGVKFLFSAWGTGQPQ